MATRPSPILAALALTLSLAPKATGQASPSPARESAGPAPRSGTALVITGAAARIPQETALLEALDERGLLKDLVFVSGVSSGALNAVALNGILAGRMTWEEYKGILFGMKTSDVFTRSGRLIPVDTTPARNLYRKVVEERLGYRRIGDLPLATALTVTRLKDLGLAKTAYRLCSRKINEESDPEIGLVDILMASTAFPLVFPPARIPGAATIPDIAYVDGGAGEDFVPFEALLEFEAARGRGVDRVYVVSRKNDGLGAAREELRALAGADEKMAAALEIPLEAIVHRKLNEGLRVLERRAPELAARTYIWKPEFPEEFQLFDFSNLERQYSLTREWAASREPVPLGLYLETSGAR